MVDFSLRPPVHMKDRVICVIENIGEANMQTNPSYRPIYRTYEGEQLFADWDDRFDVEKIATKLDYVEVSYPDIPRWNTVILSK